MTITAPRLSDYRKGGMPKPHPSIPRCNYIPQPLNIDHSLQHQSLHMTDDDVLDIASAPVSGASQARSALLEKRSYDTFRKSWESAFTLHRAICTLWTDMTASKNLDPSCWVADKEMGSYVLQTLEDVLRSMVDVMVSQLPRNARTLCISVSGVPTRQSTGWPIDCDPNHSMTIRCCSVGREMSALESAMLEKRNHEHILVDLNQLRQSAKIMKEEWQNVGPPEPPAQPQGYYEDPDASDHQAADWENDAPSISDCGEDRGERSAGVSPSSEVVLRHMKP